MDVLSMAKGSPYWDSRQGALTEITSVFEFSPYIFVVLINLLSNSADFWIAKTTMYDKSWQRKG